MHLIIFNLAVPCIPAPLPPFGVLLVRGGGSVSHTHTHTHTHMHACIHAHVAHTNTHSRSLRAPAGAHHKRLARCECVWARARGAVGDARFGVPRARPLCGEEVGLDDAHLRAGCFQAAARPAAAPKGNFCSPAHGCQELPAALRGAQSGMYRGRRVADSVGGALRR